MCSLRRPCNQVLYDKLYDPRNLATTLLMVAPRETMRLVTILLRLPLLIVNIISAASYSHDRPYQHGTYHTIIGMIGSSTPTLTEIPLLSWKWCKPLHRPTAELISAALSRPPSAIGSSVQSRYRDFYVTSVGKQPEVLHTPMSR